MAKKKKTPAAEPVQEGRFARFRKAAWIIGTAMSFVIVGVVAVNALGGDSPTVRRPTPSPPKDEGRPELVGVPASEAGCRPVEEPPYQGHVKVEPGQSHPPYSSDPPTSGWFLGIEAQPGFYGTPLPLERVMGTPARGGLVVWTAEDQVQPVSRYQIVSNASHIVSMKYPNLKSGVVFTAWGVMQRCQKFSGEVLGAFDRVFRNNALLKREPGAKTF